MHRGGSYAQCPWRVASAEHDESSGARGQRQCRAALSTTRGGGGDGPTARRSGQSASMRQRPQPLRAEAASSADCCCPSVRGIRRLARPQHLYTHTVCIVAEIDVKPDGSWRVKGRAELKDLSQWHQPDGTLSVATDTAAKPEMCIVKHEVKEEPV